MPLDEGGGRGKSKPVVRRKKPPPAPRPKVNQQARGFGADVGLFTPPALVHPRAAVVGERDKVPVPFPVRATPKERREAAEVAQRLATDQRARDALIAPISTAARGRVRRQETKAEKAVRTNVPVQARTRSEKRLAFTDDRESGRLGRAIGDIAKGIAAAGADSLLEMAWEGADNRSRIPAQAQAATLGAKAAVTPAVYLSVGPDLMNSIVGLPFSRGGRAFDLAMLPAAAAGKPVRAIRAAGKAAKVGAKARSLETALEAAEDVYRGPSVLQARKAAKAQEAVVDKAVQRVALSPAHGRALKAQLAAEEAVQTMATGLKTSTMKPAQRQAAEKELAKLKEARATARTDELYQRLVASADYRPLPPEDPRYPAREQLAKDLHSSLKNRRGALPPKATPKRIRDNMTFLEEMADRGEEGRLWYENSARAILEMTNGDVDRAEKFAQLLAIYSPQQPIIGNTSLAIRAWNEFNQAGKIGTGQTWQKAAAERVLKGEGDWEGRKTNNFYVNFLEDINPEKFRQLADAGEIRPDGVTVDLWMARVFGYGLDNVTEGRYDFVEPVVRLLAEERGWKPKQMQAAIWTAIKDASDDSSANIDFADGIARHYGQFNYEAAPQASSDFAEAYRGWSPQVQEQYARANALLVDDFLREAGLLSETSHLGPGVYMGREGIEFNPAASARVATSAAPRIGTKVSYTVHPTERAMLDRASAAIGRALDQESVAWIRPSTSMSPGHSNTVHIGLGRPGTNEEAQALWHALNGVDEHVAIMTARDGFLLRNISDTLPNIARARSTPSFESLTTKAADEVFGDTPVTMRPFASDGELIESGRYDELLGGTGDGRAAGGDLRIADAADRLARDAAELRGRFATAVGLGRDDLGDVEPQTRLEQLRQFLKPYLDLVPDDVPNPEMAVRAAALESDSPLSANVLKAIDEARTIQAGLDEEAKTAFAAIPSPYQETQERQAAGWLDNLRSLVSQEAVALGLVPVGALTDNLSASVLPIAATVGLEAAQAGVRRSRGRGLDSIYEARTLTLNELEQQLPRPRSQISQFGERLIDKASQALDNTFVSEKPGIRIISSSARVAKHAGREERQEILRRPARVRQALNKVGKVREGTPEDVAHFWYAQLPASHRNADGLQAVRDAQARELERITSGEASDDLKANATALQIALGEAETGAEAGKLMNELEKVRLLITDLPQRAEDVAASISQMDKLIAIAPPVDEDLLDALRVLAADRREILIRSGRLTPERAAERESLVAREFVNLEPDGTEIYVGHRLPPGIEGPPRMTQASAGTGRVKSPTGVGTRNNLILATTGRARPSLHVPLEDWQAAGTFETGLRSRDTLGKMGTPYKGRHKEGFTLINPKARTIPKHWRTEELAAFSETSDDVTEIRELAQDLVATFSAEGPADWERLVEEAAEMGVSWDELRMVPNHLVDRYYGQFRSFSGRSAPGVAYDAAVDFFATSIVFARIGYIPKNVVQNLIMMTPHQGAFLPMNLARAGQVVADPELRYLFQAETGASGASRAIGNERATKGVTRWALGKAAAFNGAIGDDTFRIAAFLHEAAAEGVISRTSPLLSEKDRANLVRLFNDKDRRRINDIRSRAVDAMGDFSRLTPDQARIARRLFIIPGWLVAGSRYPFHFAATHPIRSALMAFILLGEPGAPEELHFNERADTYFTGADYLRGIDTPWGRERTASLNPISTPLELGLGIKGSIEGRKGPFDFETPTAFDVANPFASSIIDVAKGETDLERLGKRLLPGSYGLGKGLIAPPGDPGQYPEDVSRLGRLKREIGIIPIEVRDPDADEETTSGRPMSRPGSGTRRAPRPGSGSRLAPRP